MTIFKKGETISEIQENLRTRIPTIEFGATTLHGTSFELDIKNFDSFTRRERNIIKAELEERGFSTTGKVANNETAKRGLLKTLRERDLTAAELSNLLRSGFSLDPETDVTAPVIRLLGFSLINLPINTPYTDAGATATDNKDGDLTSQIEVSGLPIDNTIIRTNVITYSVTDTEGNNAVVTRRVRVFDPDSSR